MLLITAQEIAREAACFESLRPLAFSPYAVETVEPATVPGYDGDCCKVMLTTSEEPRFLAVKYDDFLASLQAPEEDSDG